LICDEKGEQPTDKNEVARTVIDKRGKISKEIYNINFAGKPLKTIDAKVERRPINMKLNIVPV